LQLPVLLNIHNWCQNIHLTSPVYFVHGGKLHVAPDQKICANTVMQNRLEFDISQDILEGALAYRIQRKHAKSVQDELNHIWLLIAWCGEHIEGLHVRSLLMDYNKRFDEDKLKKLHQKHQPLLKANATRSNWALNDTTILETTTKVMNGGYRWDIFISE
jgi:hypothetical protein